jgi:hypothetical protein
MTDKQSEMVAELRLPDDLLATLPKGWSIHYLGRENPAGSTGWYMAQLSYDGDPDPNFDDITFVSRTGLTAEKAFIEAVSALSHSATKETTE